ncbi:hypothetical protein JL722_12905 [Aureococcus anophagefferens]|nr:hypothetical protein JL722_12905 [Aureococcus anophagefferens]
MGRGDVVFLLGCTPPGGGVSYASVAPYVWVQPSTRSAPGALGPSLNHLELEKQSEIKPWNATFLYVASPDAAAAARVAAAVTDAAGALGFEIQPPTHRSPPPGYPLLETAVASAADAVARFFEARNATVLARTITAMVPPGGVGDGLDPDAGRRRRAWAPFVGAPGRLFVAVALDVVPVGAATLHSLMFSQIPPGKPSKDYYENKATTVWWRAGPAPAHVGAPVQNTVAIATVATHGCPAGLEDATGRPWPCAAPDAPVGGASGGPHGARRPGDGARARGDRLPPFVILAVQL